MKSAETHHSLLQRQLRRYLSEPDPTPEGLKAFVAAVDQAYRQSDEDRAMLERAMEISSKELLASNAELREARDELELRVNIRTEELSHANVDLTREIAGRRRYEEQLLHLASHDSLTHLLNRRRFAEEVEKEIRATEANGGQGAVLFLDLDQFKDVNDTLGHSAGDDLLRSVAELLRSLVRDTDTVSRPGGDEFAVLLPATGTGPARTIAQRIEETVRRHTFTLNKRQLNITASIGVAVFPRHGSSPEEVLANADLAMYQAKNNGRGRVETFRSDRDWKSMSELRLRWRNRIAEALRDDTFVLFAQPIRSLKGKGNADFELLLRLPTEHGELVRPGVFMGIAEEFGLVQEIDRWVVRNAINLIAEQEAQGHEIRLAVNLSAKSFGDSDLLSGIRSQLGASSIDPANLITEVTETAAIAHLGRAQGFIRALKGLGCKFSLDDFGSGFSSFYHLKHLPVDYLKIDGGFIRNLSQSEVDQELVKAIVSVGQGLGKETVAEFVGDLGTLNLLQSYGVDYAQGYYIGRPREARRELLERRSSRAA